jgi:hypothetical protein
VRPHWQIRGSRVVGVKASLAQDFGSEPNIADGGLFDYTRNMLCKLTEWKKREMFLRLALLWATAAQQSRRRHRRHRRYSLPQLRRVPVLKGPEPEKGC